MWSKVKAWLGMAPKREWKSGFRGDGAVAGNPVSLKLAQVLEVAEALGAKHRAELEAAKLDLRDEAMCAVFKMGMSEAFEVLSSQFDNSPEQRKALSIGIDHVSESLKAVADLIRENDKNPTATIANVSTTAN